MYETKIMKRNFAHCSNIFRHNFSVISNRTDDLNVKPNSIWLVWDVRNWLIESTILDEHYIHCVAKNKGGFIVHATVVHGASENNEREETWEELVSLSHTIRGLWIMLGDFNEVRNREDRIGEHARASLANIGRLVRHA